jgi:dCTP deaminase
MPKLVTETKLREAVERGTYFTGGDPESVEGIKYDFHTGNRILKASYGRPVNVDELTAAERNSLFIAPGEVVFVLTKERLNLPNNIMATLLPKRKMSHGGISVLGGQAIDPRYSGVLWFGMYNFSSTPYPLMPGRKLIAAMFYELSDAEVEEFPVPEAAHIDDFPDDLIRLINNYKPIELKGVLDELQETKRDLAALKADLTTDKQWKRDFQDNLDRQSKEIDKLLDGLKEEKEARREEDTAIRGRLDTMSDVFAGFKNVWVIVALILAALAGWLVPKIFDRPPPPASAITAPAPPTAPTP